MGRQALTDKTIFRFLVLISNGNQFTQETFCAKKCRRKQSEACESKSASKTSFTVSTRANNLICLTLQIVDDEIVCDLVYERI